MQQLQGQFPEVTDSSFGLPGQLPVVLVDNVAATTGWTSGVQSIAVLNSQPTLTRPWTIYGFGVRGQGTIGPGTGALYGKLGKLFAALLLGRTLTPQNNVPFNLVPDTSGPNVLELWDGAQDPAFPMLPPTLSPLPPGGYFQGALQLPQPQLLSSGDQLAIALWLTPSLTNKCATLIRHAGWTVVYDTQ